MNVTPATLTTDEQEQLKQTVEMFEVFVQASPQDCQSMEILKDAYARLGRQQESLAISRKLADAYSELGQLSQAILEYESILQQDPANPEVIAAMGEVEERLHKSGEKRSGSGGLGGPVSPPAAAAIAPPPELSGGLGGPVIEPAPDGANPPEMIRVDVSEPSSLIATSHTAHREVIRTAHQPAVDNPLLLEDGNEPLARFLIQHRLVPEEIVTNTLERVVKKNLNREPGTFGASLIDEIVKRGIVDLDVLLSGILDRSKFAYIPLHYYEVDRSVVKMLPEEITLGRLIIPFDIMSRTLMVALANPFDAAGKAAVQQQLDYHIQWHLAPPEAITKVLTETYRIGANISEGSTFRLA